MSEKEKERVRLEKERQAELERLERLAQNEAEAKKAIEKNISEPTYECDLKSEFGIAKLVYRNISYYHRDTNAFKEFFVEKMSFGEIYEDEVKDYFEMIGYIVSHKFVSLQEAQEMVGNLHIIDKKVKVEVA